MIMMMTFSHDVVQSLTFLLGDFLTRRPLTTVLLHCDDDDDDDDDVFTSRPKSEPYVLTRRSLIRGSITTALRYWDDDVLKLLQCPRNLAQGHKKRAETVYRDLNMTQIPSDLSAQRECSTLPGDEGVSGWLSPPHRISQDHVGSTCPRAR